jgi:hypothetical protein
MDRVGIPRGDFCTGEVEIGTGGWRKTERGRERERDGDKAVVSLWCYSAERGYVEINARPSEMNLADQNAGLTIPVDTQR